MVYLAVQKFWSMLLGRFLNLEYTIDHQMDYYLYAMGSRMSI